MSDSCEWLLVPNYLWLIHFNSRVIPIGYFPHDYLWPNPQKPLTSQIWAQVSSWVLSFSFKFPSIFTAILSFPVSYYSFWIGILLMLSSRLLLLNRYHLPIRGVSTSIFMAFGVNFHVISAINGLHHFIPIPLRGSLYIHSWLDIITLLNLGPSLLMTFIPPTILPSLLISSLICNLLSTVRLIG